MKKLDVLLNELEDYYKEKYHYFIETLNDLDIVTFSNENPYKGEEQDYTFMYYRDSENAFDSYDVSHNTLIPPHTQPKDGGYIKGIRVRFRDFIWLLKRKEGIEYIRWFENMHHLDNNKNFKRRNSELQTKYNHKLKEHLINTYGFDILNAIETYVFNL
jgi:hypothetical protein